MDIEKLKKVLRLLDSPEEGEAANAFKVFTKEINSRNLNWEIIFEQYSSNIREVRDLRNEIPDNIHITQLESIIVDLRKTNMNWQRRYLAILNKPVKLNLETSKEEWKSNYKWAIVAVIIFYIIVTAIECFFAGICNWKKLYDNSWLVVICLGLFFPFYFYTCLFRSKTWEWEKWKEWLDKLFSGY